MGVAPVVIWTLVIARCAMVLTAVNLTKRCASDWPSSAATSGAADVAINAVTGPGQEAGRPACYHPGPRHLLQPLWSSPVLPPGLASAAALPLAFPFISRSGPAPDGQHRPAPDPARSRGRCSRTPGSAATAASRGRWQDHAVRPRSASWARSRSPGGRYHREFERGLRATMSFTTGRG